MEENTEVIDLTTKSNSLINTATDLVIKNQKNYEIATNCLKEVKSMSKQIKDYWKEPKEQASKAHKSVVAKEKQMLEPFEKIEGIIKFKVSNYVLAQEETKRLEEQKLKEEQEKLALEELEKAEQLRQEGNEIEAQITEQNAIAISELETKIQSNVQNIEGISYRKDYQIIIKNKKEIPVYVNEIEIRPVDTQALKKVIRMSNNGVKIPGIEINEIKTPVVRT